MISDDKLHMLIENHDAFPPTLVEMAKELLAHRKAWSEPVAWELVNPRGACGIEKDMRIVEIFSIFDGNHIHPLYRKPSTE